MQDVLKQQQWQVDRGWQWWILQQAPQQQQQRMQLQSQADRAPALGGLLGCLRLCGGSAGCCGGAVRGFVGCCLDACGCCYQMGALGLALVLLLLLPAVVGCLVAVHGVLILRRVMVWGGWRVGQRWCWWKPQLALMK
jgi:hypothetical protein